MTEIPREERPGEGAEERAEPVIRDKRRIDPRTGELREPAAAPAPQPAPGQVPQPPADRAADGLGTDPAGDAAAARAEGLAAQLAERTADLQRLQADFANYRKRVERDRLATQEMALANVLANLLPVLDDIGRARAHGELEGGFKSVAEALEATLAKLGLAAYGDAGDPFDPMVHEALTHSYSAEVSEPTCVAILQPGYKLGERVMRPARVAVAEPTPAPASEAESGEEPTVETAAGEPVDQPAGDPPASDQGA